ncbi:YbaK/EbsC family protein [Xylocopilactobacillus apicola]|uniref:Cys-tRNA(Pro)/Cys-tRNA(Cys) deacylase n=1 Tax=Xylocopilactobacillus apicola TaxID=2932184 RepID=A0AAU9CWJ7_9LACO|nr:YbaK/EbsC family protein [Xylocopilactobacillus apicola]BDR58357.1 Cys-tRNA(Pro)/Cys-tRNA(Cys) deacylase [Xylocopilactobacillus apicola]
MAKKQKKTLIEKFLDKEQILYEPLSVQTHLDGDVYAIDDQHRLPQVFKTLVLTGNKTGPVVGVVQLIDRIDYKKMSQVTGNKKVGLVPLKDLVKTSGYLHGENTPIGIYNNKHFKIYYDEAINNFESVIVSAGEIGRMVKINGKELVKITEGSIVDIAERNTNV